ncbi:cytochrome P450 4c3-like [Zootermopsis nevadensis]|uniref:Cytochrome P450 4c3 n=1 Tax=Zootermopsis nevadensis TaxID=136037 RepID=A0A067QWH6_ZOONE|nr:cytochrome P450 4c3-like [Zootermopsis nevadensis]XP_021929276.1 cytochrome P450 4c3-like [Zootermopsis nevadensis]KDR14497.1 Cytochrome P450 4c3 [Zootermopsis nevadensis]
MLDIVLTTLGSVLFLVVAFFAVFPYGWKWFFRRSDIKKVNMIPGPKTVPIFGNILLFNVPEEELWHKFRQIHKEYGPTFRIWVLGVPEVFITDPEDVEVILSSPSHIKKSMDYDLIQPWLGTGLLTSFGNKWHSRRKLLTPAFHFKILEDYIKVFNSNSKILIDKLTNQVGEPYVDITSYIAMCTLDIICETAMGVTINAQNNGEAEYITAVKRMTKVIVKRQFSPWLYKDYIYYLSPLGREQVRLQKFLHSFTNQVIKERREEYRNNIKSQENNMPKSKRRRLAFLDLLIEMSENGGLLSDSDIREEVDTFMFEGHDTTSLAISWTMYLLGCHPEIQEKVVHELKDIFGDSDREATYEDLQQMKYLEQVIKESLRLYPSVPAFSRQVEVDVKLKNYTIPAGTQTPILSFIMHRNPKVFPNPEEFNPDHFLPENVVNRHPFAYIPFSAGPRSCIGQRFAMFEEKIVLSSVLRKLRLESLDRREDVPLLLELVLRPKHELRIKISSR